MDILTYVGMDQNLRNIFVKIMAQLFWVIGRAFPGSWTPGFSRRNSSNLRPADAECDLFVDIHCRGGVLQPGRQIQGSGLMSHFFPLVEGLEFHETE